MLRSIYLSASTTYVVQSNERLKLLGIAGTSNSDGYKGVTIKTRGGEAVIRVYCINGAYGPVTWPPEGLKLEPGDSITCPAFETINVIVEF